METVVYNDTPLAQYLQEADSFEEPTVEPSLIDNDEIDNKDSNNPKSTTIKEDRLEDIFPYSTYITSYIYPFDLARYFFYILPLDSLVFKCHSTTDRRPQQQVNNMKTQDPKDRLHYLIISSSLMTKAAYGSSSTTAATVTAGPSSKLEQPSDPSNLVITEQPSMNFIKSKFISGRILFILFLLLPLVYIFLPSFTISWLTLLVIALVHSTIFATTATTTTTTPTTDQQQVQGTQNAFDKSYSTTNNLMNTILNLNSACDDALNCIRDIECVSHGLKISDPMPPISRLESSDFSIGNDNNHVQHPLYRASPRLRQVLSNTLTSIHALMHTTCLILEPNIASSEQLSNLIGMYATASDHHIDSGVMATTTTGSTGATAVTGMSMARSASSELSESISQAVESSSSISSSSASKPLHLSTNRRRPQSASFFPLSPSNRRNELALSTSSSGINPTPSPPHDHHYYSTITSVNGSPPSAAGRRRPTSWSSSTPSPLTKPFGLYSNPSNSSTPSRRSRRSVVDNLRSSRDNNNTSPPNRIASPSYSDSKRYSLASASATSWSMSSPTRSSASFQHNQMMHSVSLSQNPSQQQRPQSQQQQQQQQQQQNHPNSLLGLAQSIRQRDIAIRKMLCYILALDNYNNWPDSIYLQLDSLTSELDSLSSNLYDQSCQILGEDYVSIFRQRRQEQEAETKPNSNSNLPGEWNHNSQEQQPSTSTSRLKESMSNNNDFAPRESSSQKYTTSIDQMNKEYKKLYCILRSISAKLHLASSDIKAIAKIDSSSNSLLDFDENKAQNVLQAHDSIRLDIENLVQNWKDSRTNLRKTIDSAKKLSFPNQEGQSGTQEIQSDNDLDDHDDQDQEFLDFDKSTQDIDVNIQDRDVTADGVLVSGYDNPEQEKSQQDRRQLINDLAELLLADTSPTSLPPPGEEDVYAAEDEHDLSGSTAKALFTDNDDNSNNTRQKSKLSRQERIKLQREKREQKQKGQLDLDLDGPSQSRKLDVDMVNELRGVMFRIKEKQREHAANRQKQQQTSSST